MDNKEKGVVFCIRNKSGRFLLEQRDQNSKFDPWHFVFPGGGVESCDVDSVDTAIREAKEEFGVLLQRENIKKIIAVPRRNQKPGLSVVYFTEVNQSAPFVVSESGGMAWFTLEEIEKMELGYEQNTRILPVLKSFLLTLK